MCVRVCICGRRKLSALIVPLDECILVLEVISRAHLHHRLASPLQARGLGTQMARGPSVQTPADLSDAGREWVVQHAGRDGQGRHQTAGCGRGDGAAQAAAPHHPRRRPPVHAARPAGTHAQECTSCRSSRRVICVSTAPICTAPLRPCSMPHIRNQAPSMHFELLAAKMG